ncbi:MAG: glycosyltransferase family 4 protein [Pseudomonadota bacterium]
MRILFLSPTLGDAYGQERIVRDTNAILRENGHQTFFLADHLVGALPPCDASFTLPGLAQVNTLSFPWKVFHLKRKLKATLREIDPDVIHLIDQFDFRIMNFLSQRYPCLLTAHTVAPTCPSSQRFFPLGGGVCEFQSGWSCLKVHQQEQCLGHFKSIFHRAHALWEFKLKKRALKQFPVIGAISPYLETRLKKDGYSEAQVTPIYNSVSVRKTSLLPLSLAPQNLLVVASRLVPLKGISSLILCLNQLKELPWTCWIFGDGPQRQELQELTAKLNLTSRVLFKGKTSSIEIQRALLSAKALLQPNRGPEGFGMAAAEASALGVPVLGYDIPALNDLIVSGETGLLAPLHPETGLSDSLRQIIENTDLSQRLREKGPERMEKLYSSSQHLQQTLRAYLKCQEVFLELRRQPNRLKQFFQFGFVFTKFLGPNRSRH